MAHTHRFKIDSRLGEFADAHLYSSGGELHTVVLESVWGNDTIRRSFRGIGARSRAKEWMIERQEALEWKWGKMMGAGR